MNTQSISRLARRVLAAALLAVTLLSCAPLPAHAASAPSHGESIYSQEYFSEEYANGYLALSGKGTAKGLSWTKASVYNSDADGNEGWRVTNTSRKSDVYIDYYKGAYMNGTAYDVRVYPWSSHDSDGRDQLHIGTNGGVSLIKLKYSLLQNRLQSGDRWIAREFHFYKAGTLKTSTPQEVTFRGILRFDDIDDGEYYQINQGLHKAYLAASTNVVKQNTTNPRWMGTASATGGDGPGALWIEAECTPSKPLTVVYGGNTAFGSYPNYMGRTLSYTLVPDGTHKFPAGLEAIRNTGCANYANYRMNVYTEEYPRYVFDGWYTDAALTDKVPDVIQINSNRTFYGKYTQTHGLIETEVVNGDITPTDEAGILFGQDKRIYYSPAYGYTLSAITVDGVPLDIRSSNFKNSEYYDFNNVQDDHTIRVVYSRDDVAGVRPHVDVSGSNVNIYAENYTSGPDALDAFVRVRLEEYMEIGKNAGQDVVQEERAKSLVDSASMTDESTWTIHKEGESVFSHYWYWYMGGETVYMPSFNRNKDSDAVETNGTCVFTNHVQQANDYVEYGMGDEVTDQAVYDADDNDLDEGADAVLNTNYKLVNETHQAQSTLTATCVMTMEQWLDYGGDFTGNFWVADTDGWYYWASPLSPGDATGCLVSGINMIRQPGDNWYYGVNAVFQAVTAQDAGRNDGSGFFTGLGPTENAITLLNTLGVNTDYVGYVALTPETLTDVIQPGGSLQFAASCVLPGYGGAIDQSVIWTVSGNTSPDTYVNDAGYLQVGADETADVTLTVTATSAAYGVTGNYKLTVRDDLMGMFLHAIAPRSDSAAGKLFSASLAGWGLRG